MKTYQIEINGDNQSDIENALEEVIRLIRGGFDVGFDRNSTGSFSFTSNGEFEKPTNEDDGE